MIYIRMKKARTWHFYFNLKKEPQRLIYQRNKKKQKEERTTCANLKTKTGIGEALHYSSGGHVSDERGSTYED